MKSGQLYRLMDLIEDIRKVDAMLIIHQKSDGNSLMVSQYEARKTKLMGQLIDELVSPSVQSPESFSLIQKVIAEFYPSSDLSTSLDSDIKRLAKAI